MRVTYKAPEGDQVWSYVPERTLSSQAEMIERRYGSPFQAWKQAIKSGESKARRVLLWHLLCLQHPINWVDTPDYAEGDLLVEMNEDELTELLEQGKRMPLSDDEREAFEAQVHADIEAARLDGRGSSPKAKSKT